MNLERFFRRSAADAELTQELEAHLQHEVDDNLARGMNKEEAVRQARVKLGSVRRIRESIWESNSMEWFETVLRDLRYSIRTLSRTPGFTVTAIFVMALGIGANVALFTVVRSVLLKPLPFREPERLLRLYEHSADEKIPYNQVAAGIFAEWKRQSHSFSNLAIVSTSGEYNLSGAGGKFPERVRAVEFSSDLLPTLGVEPALGRGFTAAD